MTREDMLEDLAYVRTLAEEGRRTPLLGGAYLVFFGTMNAIAFAGHWAILDGRLPAADGAAFWMLWLGYAVIAAIGLTYLRTRTRTRPGLTSFNSRAERAVWAGVGMAMSAVALGSIARMLLEQDTTAPNAIFGVAFALYGAALMAVAMISEQGWIRTFSWLSMLVAGMLCLFANQHWAYLIAAIGSVLVLTWPGFILLKREPAEIV